MKIAYFFTWSDDLESGVMKKVRDQVAFWEKEGHRVKVFILTKRDSRFQQKFHNLANTSNISWHCLSYDGLIERSRQYANLYNKVESFKPDIVYLRKCKYSPGAYRILKRFASVMELNGKPKPFKLCPGHIYDQLTLRLLLNNLRGFIAVGKEIGQTPLYAARNKPVKVIGNSIDQSRYEVLPPAVHNEEVTFVFIGSPGQPWQGVDKILELGKMRPSWLFHIIGCNAGEFGFVSKEMSNVTFHGKMDGEQYLKIFGESDIAIGSTAQHRRGMNETSTLKMREYLTCGLPVITGHKDPDFTGKEPYILELPNYERNVVDHIEEIDAFSREWKGKRVDRKLVEHIDVRFKEKERLAFFTRIIKNNNDSETYERLESMKSSDITEMEKIEYQ